MAVFADGLIRFVGILLEGVFWGEGRVLVVSEVVGRGLY